MKFNQIDKALSTRFSNMSVLCAVLVVFIHLPKPASMPALWFWAAISHGVAKIAVPFFFLAAGFFLAGKFQEDNWYKQAVVKRVSTLLIPLLIWDVAWAVWTRLIVFVSNIVNGREIGAYIDGLTIKEFLRILALWPFDQPELSVLWFVRTLFVLVLLSPLLKKISSLPFIFLLWLVHGAIHPDYGSAMSPLVFTLQEGFFSLFGMVYFCLGIYLRAHQGLLSKSYWWALGVGCSLLVARGMPYGSLFADRMTWLATPFLLAGIWSLIPTISCPTVFRGGAFPIFVLHRFVIFLLDYLRLVPSGNIVSYVGSGLTVVGFCIVFAYMIKRLSPNIASLVFGGR